MKIDYTAVRFGNDQVSFSRRTSNPDDRWPEQIAIQERMGAVLQALGALHLLPPDHIATGIGAIASATSADRIPITAGGAGCSWNLSPVATLALIVAQPGPQGPGATMLSVVLDFDVLSDPEVELRDVEAAIDRIDLLPKIAAGASLPEAG